MDLVSQQLRDLEKDCKSYVIEGFPRTRAQAVALQRTGIVADKFFLLTVSESTIYKKVRASLGTEGAADPGSPKRAMTEAQIDAIAHKVILENQLYPI